MPSPGPMRSGATSLRGSGGERVEQSTNAPSHQFVICDSKTEHMARLNIPGWHDLILGT